jgi:hypothetical protein
MEEDRARWAELIATSLQVSGLSEEELERKLAWTPGSLGRLLDGEGDLEPDQVLEILGELNESNRSRKSKEAAGAGRTQVATELMERFRLLGYETRQAVPPPAEPSSLKELEKKVESILRRAYGEPPGSPGGGKGGKS